MTPTLGKSKWCWSLNDQMFTGCTTRQEYEIKLHKSSIRHRASARWDWIKLQADKHADDLKVQAVKAELEKFISGQITSEDLDIFVKSMCKGTEKNRVWMI